MTTKTAWVADISTYRICCSDFETVLPQYGVTVHENKRSQMSFWSIFRSWKSVAFILLDSQLFSIHPSEQATPNLIDPFVAYMPQKLGPKLNVLYMYRMCLAETLRSNYFCFIFLFGVGEGCSCLKVLFYVQVQQHLFQIVPCSIAALTECLILATAILIYV